jgi:hypothetical protein
MSRSYLEVFSSLEENQVQRLTFRGLNRRLLVEGKKSPKTRGDRDGKTQMV